MARLYDYMYRALYRDPGTRRCRRCRGRSRRVNLKSLTPDKPGWHVISDSESESKPTPAGVESIPHNLFHTTPIHPAALTASGPGS
eukprot:1560121-Rhodomonas_salina.1